MIRSEESIKLLRAGEEVRIISIIAYIYSLIYSLALLLKRSDSTHGGCGPPEGKVTLVRKERVAAASSLPVIRLSVCRAATP